MEGIVRATSHSPASRRTSVASSGAKARRRSRAVSSVGYLLTSPPVLLSPIAMMAPGRARRTPAVVAGAEAGKVPMPITAPRTEGEISRK